MGVDLQKAGKMKPKKSPSKSPQEEMFRVRLDVLVDPRHSLVQLGKRVDWKWFEDQYDGQFGQLGRPALPVRLVVGLTILKHMESLSDEEVVVRWVENPYWQHFCGREFFEHKLPCDPTSLTRWRARFGEDGVKKMLSESLRVAAADGQLRLQDLAEVVVDTTVQPKDVAYPTDAKLLNKARVALVKAAVRAGLVLRRSYKRAGKAALFMSARYRHAKHFKRARRKERSLRTYLGAVMRDVRRKAEAAGVEIQGTLQQALRIAQRIHHQVTDRTAKNKVYSVHQPHVACIAKGKAHQPFEFGSKVSIATTVRGNWVVGIENFAGNPFDGATLRQATEGAEKVTGFPVARAFVDKGYRGRKHHPEGVQVLISGRRNLRPPLARKLKRRQSIEPVIGHLKADHRLRRNFLKGELGDVLNAVLAAVGFNFRKLMRVWHLAWLVFVQILRALFASLPTQRSTRGSIVPNALTA